MFIPYAAAVLKIACDGISRHWGIYIVSFASSISSFLWLGYWVYVANGLDLWADLDGGGNGDGGDDPSTATNTATGAYYDDYYNSGGTMTGKSAAKVFVLLLSLYWTSIVLMVRYYALQCNRQIHDLSSCSATICWLIFDAVLIHTTTHLLLCSSPLTTFNVIQEYHSDNRSGSHCYLLLRESICRFQSHDFE